jgi:hypothetical protein
MSESNRCPLFSDFVQNATIVSPESVIRVFQEKHAGITFFLHWDEV